jgi:hypothetical protein
MTTSLAGKPETRARRPYPDDALEDLQIPASAMLVKALPKAIGAMEEFAVHRYRLGLPADAGVQAALGRLEASQPALAEAERARADDWKLPPAPISADLIAEAAAALENAGRVCRQAIYSNISASSAWFLEEVIRYAETITATLKARGEYGVETAFTPVR